MAEADGLIHATPTGMTSHAGLPLPVELLRASMWVAEIVYFPLETQLLRAARRIGSRTPDGGSMAAGAGLAEPGTAHSSGFSWARVEQLLGHRQVWGACLGQFGGNSTWVFFLTWFPTDLATDVLGDVKRLEVN